MATIHYDWDDLEDNIVEEYDDTGATIAEYTTQPGLYGNVISQRRGGQDSYFHYDGQGSTLALTNSNGDVTDTYAYSAFGEVTARTGIAVNPFQYIGQKQYYRDAETGEYDVRRRPLESKEGRWISEDPLAVLMNDTNGFSYVYNCAALLTDPSGLIPCTTASHTTFTCEGTSKTIKLYMRYCCKASRKCEGVDVTKDYEPILKASLCEVYSMLKKSYDMFRYSATQHDDAARQVRQCIRKFFSPLQFAPTVDQLGTIEGRLLKLLNAFNEEITIECESWCFGDKKGYVWANRLWTSSVVHVCPCAFEDALGKGELLRTIIHEFTHRYAGTIDYSYVEWQGSEEAPPRYVWTWWTGKYPRPDDLVWNADTYAWFIDNMYHGVCTYEPRAEFRPLIGCSPKDSK